MRIWVTLTAAALVVGACGDDGYTRPVAKAGEVVTVVDGDTPGVPDGSFLMDIAVGQGGVLYVALRVRDADRVDHGLILAIPAEGEPRVVADEVERAFPSPEAFTPDALAVDPSSGTVYVADATSQRIRAVSADGTLSNVTDFADGRVKGPPGTYLQDPHLLAFDPTTGDLFMGDTCQAARIHGDEITVVFGADPRDCRDPSGDHSWAGLKDVEQGAKAVEVSTVMLSGLAVDPESGRLHVVTNAGVMEIDAGGALRLVAGEGDVALGDRELIAPLELDMEFADGTRQGGGGIALGRAGTFYLGSKRDPVVVRAVLEPPKVTKVAEIDDPHRIAVGGDGDIYIGSSFDGYGTFVPPLVQVVRDPAD